MVYFWVRKVTFHSVCMYVHVILLHCFPSLVFILNLNKLWTNTSSRHYTDEKKKERLFIWVCTFCFHESAYWGQYFYVSNCTGLTFYVVIRAMWRSSHLQGKGSTIPSFLSYQMLSIGLTLGDEAVAFIYGPECTWTPRIC